MVYKRRLTITAIVFTHCNGYEFSKKGFNDFAFVKVYYEWDQQKYLSERLNVIEQF